MKINVKFSNAAEWEAFINLLSAQGYKTWKGCTWAAHKRRTVNGRVKYTRFTDKFWHEALTLFTLKS